MRPSESGVGKAWLSNFHPTEVAAATLLLDSIRVVPLRRLREGLLELVTALDIAERQPFVVYPERRIDSFEGIAHVDAPVAWEDFAPGAPISLTEAGSDAFVAMVLKEMRSSNDHAIGGIEPDASLENLRVRRCRTVVIATDVVASGHQAEELAAAIARNPSIRSWRSYGLLEIRVAAFAALQTGIDHLAQSSVVDAFDYVELAPTVASISGDSQRDAVTELCRRYGGKNPLGYADTGALFATERRAPDNVPTLLLRRGSDSWNPLFPDRKVPAGFAAEIGNYRAGQSLQEVAEQVGQLRLGRNRRVESIRAESRDLLQILTLAAATRITPAEVSASLGRDLPAAQGLMSSLQSWGFLDESGAATTAGRRELAEYKRGRRQTTATLQGSDEPYYHRGVR